MKICIVKLSSIGDIAHNAFVPSLIKENIPGCEIHWVCDKTFTDITQYNPFIGKTHTVVSKGAKRKPLSFITQLPKLWKLRKIEKFDFVIDLQGTFKSAIISRMLCYNSNLWGFKNTRDFVANKIYKKYCKVPLQTNVFERAIQMLKEALGIEVSRKSIRTPFVYANENPVKKRGDVLIFPSSSKVEKNYSVENFRRIVRSLRGYKITLLFGSATEKLICNLIARDFNNVSIIGNLSLSDVKSVILSHKWVVGGDTGILHIAAGLGVRNIILYGPTPAYRTSLHQSHSVALQGNGDVNKVPVNEVIKIIKFSNV